MVLKSFLRVRTCKQSPFLLEDNRVTGQGPSHSQSNNSPASRAKSGGVALTKSGTDQSRNTADSWYSYIEGQAESPDDISSIHYGESAGSPYERHVRRELQRQRKQAQKSRTELDGMTGKTASFSDDDDDEDGDEHEGECGYEYDGEFENKGNAAANRNVGAEAGFGMDTDEDIIHKHLDDINPGPVDVDDAIYDPYEDQQEAMYRQQHMEQQKAKRAKQGGKQQQLSKKKKKDLTKANNKNPRKLFRQQRETRKQKVEQQKQERSYGSLADVDFSRSLTDDDFQRVLNEAGAEVPDYNGADNNIKSLPSATEVELGYDCNTNSHLVGRRHDAYDDPSTTVHIIDESQSQPQEFVEEDDELRKRRESKLGHRREMSDMRVAASLGPTDDDEEENEDAIYLAKDLSVFCVSLLKQDHSYMKKHGLLPSNDPKSEYVPPKTPTERVVRDTLQRYLDRFVQMRATRTGKVCHRRQSRLAITRKISKAMLKDPVQIELLAQECLNVGDYEQSIRFYALLLEKQQTMAEAETAETLTKLSVLHLALGNRNRSIAFAKRALKWNREESRREATVVALLLIGLIYLAGNKLEKALTTWREALQMSCMIFGYDHPILATLLNNIGCLHYHRGDLPASLRTFSESLDLQRKFLSTNSSHHANSILLDIAVTKGNMAVMASKQGDVSAAESLLEEVLSVQESVLMDRNHFLVTLTHHNLDRLVGDELDPFDDNDDETAFAHEREARDLFLNGDDGGCVSTAVPDFSVASGGLSSRKPYFSSAAKSLNTSSTSHNAQNGIQHKDSYSVERAQSISARVSSHLSIFGDDDGIPMRRIGAKSPLDAMDATDNLDTLTLGSLAEEHTPRQRVRAAVLKFFNKTLQDDEDRKLPFVAFDHAPRRRNRIPIDLDQDNVMDAELYLEGIHDQAYEHLEHNEINEALELFECVLSSHKDKFGTIHHLVGTCNHNIGLVHLYAERYDPAMAFFQEAVAIRQASLGPEHPDVASSLMKIGMIQLARRDADEARETFKQVLDLARDGLGYGHIQVARVLNNLAVAFYDLGSYLECFQAFEQAYEIQRRLLLLSISENTAVLNQAGIIEISLANTLLNMGFLYARQKKYVDALSMIQEGYKLRQKHFAKESPDVRDAEENLKYVRLLLGKESDNYETEDEGSIGDAGNVTEEKKTEEQPAKPKPNPAQQWGQLRQQSISSATSLSSSIITHQQDLLENFVGDAIASIKGKFKCY